MSWYNEEAYESLRRRGYTSFNSNYGYLMYGDYDTQDHGYYNRSGDRWDDGSFMGDGSFYMAAGIWVCFTALLLVQGAWAFLRSHAVEKRRVSEIFHLITSSRRAYEKPKAAAASTATAQDAPSADDDAAKNTVEDDVEGPTTSPHEAVGTTNGKQPAGDCMVGIIEENMNECPLCLEDYEDGDQVSKLPCGHSFHSACIEKWLLSTTFQARTCPNCRQTPLVSDLEFEEIENEQMERRAAEQVERRTAEQLMQRFTFNDHAHHPFLAGGHVGVGMPAFNSERPTDDRHNDDYSLFGWASAFNFLPPPPPRPSVTPFRSSRPAAASGSHGSFPEVSMV